jgi:hypothetical protein
MRRRHLLCAILISSLTACAPATNAVPIGSEEVQGRTTDYIGAAEMRSVGANDALEAINRLRPFFFRRGRETSAVTGQSLLQVYLDNIKLGGLETLQTIPIESIKSIQYLSSSEATIRWGTNHTGGVILLSSSKGE